MFRNFNTLSFLTFSNPLSAKSPLFLPCVRLVGCVMTRKTFAIVRCHILKKKCSNGQKHCYVCSGVFVPVTFPTITICAYSTINLIHFFKPHPTYIVQHPLKIQSQLFSHIYKHVIMQFSVRLLMSPHRHVEKDDSLSGFPTHKETTCGRWQRNCAAICEATAKYLIIY